MKHIILLFIILFTVASCKTSKLKKHSEDIQSSYMETSAKINEENIIKNEAEIFHLERKHLAINRSFETAHIISDVSYSDPNFSQNTKADIRIEKGKQILITVKALMVNVAKVYITPNRVSYYEIIKGTHYDGNFELLESIIGTPITYNQVENILLGESIYPITNGFNLYENSSQYILEKKINDFLLSIILNDTGELLKEQIHLNEEVYADLSYKSFQNVRGVAFPKQWQLISNAKHKMNISLDYEKVTLNSNVNFKYEIPSGSKPIKF